ncbi:MAG: hypothetical protein IKC26_02180 [Clostridia bacterium]|nr:hypothetical protein [Clostridia bacterium]
MNKKDWNEGLDHLDTDLVEKYVEQRDRLRQQHKKPLGIWLRFGTIAACLALIVSAVFAMPRLWKDEPIGPPNPDTTGSNTTPIIPIVNLQAPSSAPQYYGIAATGSDEGAQGERNQAGLSVTAQFVEALPDTYTFFNDWNQTEFRLLRMKTVSLLKGQEMTDEFYYMIPVDYMTDYSIYDKLVIIDMGQYGYEISVVYNRTQGCAERLELVLFGYANTHFYFLGEKVMAFDSSDRFDMRLWNSTEKWAEETSGTVELRGEEYYQSYTLQEAEEDARQEYNDFYVHLLEDISGEAADVLSKILSFENGIYVPSSSGSKLSLSPEVQFSAERYINGFATNEAVWVKSKEWNGGDQDLYSFTKARFDESDLSELPDLPSAFASIKDAVESGSVPAPHFHNQIKLRNTTNGIFGWYAKTEAGVIGIVRVTWCFFSEGLDFFYDDAYYIVEYGSNVCKPIDRDALLERLGEYEATYIYTGEYGEYGKVFDTVYPVA